VDLLAADGAPLLLRAARIGSMRLSFSPQIGVCYMQQLILHPFYGSSIRKACAHELPAEHGEKNDAKLTDICRRVYE